eukprot:9284952-Alexandrium_andersonii.AAC.1
MCIRDSAVQRCKSHRQPQEHPCCGGEECVQRPPASSLDCSHSRAHGPGPLRLFGPGVRPLGGGA